jgi:hypothetical protein
MKKGYKKIYSLIAFFGMIGYIVFVIARSAYLVAELGSGFFWVPVYVLSSTAPVFVSLEAVVFASHGISEMSKLRTKFPKWRAVLDILFGAVGVFVLCIRLGVSAGTLAGYEFYPYIYGAMTAGTVAICLYWGVNIIINMVLREKNK